MGSDRGQQVTLILKAITQPEASHQSRQRAEAESRWGSQRPGGLLISSICEQRQGMGWGPQLRKERHCTVPGAHDGGEPGQVESPWSSPPRGNDHEGKGRRAKHTGRHCTPHTPKLTSGGTCPSHHWPLSGHRDSSRQRIPKREGDSGAVSRVGVRGRLQSLLSPRGLAVPRPHGPAGPWTASGPSRPTL